ncbi:MAG: four helix bundle protein [Vicingaceae bacterium]
MNSEELENRLVDFSISVSQICASLEQTELGKNLSQQLIRSSTSSALNFGESRGAESKKDFIHKLRITLKELRESFISLKILEKSASSNNADELDKVVDECNQLISIFVASIRTAENK